MIVNSDKMMTAQMRKMMKAMQQDGGMMGAEPPSKLQVNPRHPLVKNLAALRENDAELAKLISHQIFDNARMAAGLIEDPATMLQRNYELMEKLSAR
jgi:molecular chaperone HtpG